MSILILGGDGYLGWPTAMYFSDRGYDVVVVDNYFRRKACDELDTGLLYPVPNLIDRAKLWHQLTGKEIKVIIGDLTNDEFTRSLFNSKSNYDWALSNNSHAQPTTVVHYAEQPSAPYSMMNYKYAGLTITNNLQATNNLMWAVKDLSPETHIIKLGTMGEYGTPNIDIEEGWLVVTHKGREQKFLYPRQGGSVYHTTKIMDTDLLWFGVRNWDLRVTDLMQGPVYGNETEESKIDPRLKTLFNYDEIFGTILNRFIVQAAIDYPLSVYGKGGQKRGFLNIKDTLQCVHKAELKPADKGELRIFNQITETFSVNELATKTQKAGAALGIKVNIEHIENPRKELEDHYYNPTYQGLVDIGVVPHLLSDEYMIHALEEAISCKDNIRRDVIFKGIKW
ncbi:MAG: NAD-dependent epimerase/dehydratase family protein [Cyclobacteriaceae bacterium]|nr:NAD-dependent epimerase/dehydratase family protein [Cyclobacteriaceae bacterium]